MTPQDTQPPASQPQTPPAAIPQFDPLAPPPITAVPVATVPQQVAVPASSPAAGADSIVGGDVPLPTEAADNDVIENSWVMKAKEIVSDTHDNPYKQVRELNKLKADYMKKRYNKELKLPND